MGGEKKKKKNGAHLGLKEPQFLGGVWVFLGFKKNQYLFPKKTKQKNQKINTTKIFTGGLKKSFGPPKEKRKIFFPLKIFSPILPPKFFF